MKHRFLSGFVVEAAQLDALEAKSPRDPYRESRFEGPSFQLRFQADQIHSWRGLMWGRISCGTRWYFVVGTPWFEVWILRPSPLACDPTEGT